ncbi:MAG: CDP-alcohol phosphatidyltransferase family protein [Pseudomonadales bacterium]
MWKTWANLLTALRLVCVAPCAWAIVLGHLGPAAALFTIAVVSDYLDGPVARRFDNDSPAGGLFDHATDALFVAVNLSALAWIGLLDFWLPLLVVLAFTQYLFDSRALVGASLRASILGKNNGIAYFVMIGIPVIRNALGWSWPPDSWIAALGWILVITTLASMTDRAVALLKNR